MSFRNSKVPDHAPSPQNDLGHQRDSGTARPWEPGQVSTGPEGVLHPQLTTRDSCYQKNVACRGGRLGPCCDEGRGCLRYVR